MTDLRHPDTEVPPPPLPAGAPGTAEAQDGLVPYAGLRLAALIAGLVALGIWNPWMLVVITALVVMITLHEFGHYVMAKRAGMKVTEFFLFFGPKVWSFRRGETEYGIKCIPAGAYVKIIGMHNLEEVPPADEGRTYRQKTFPQRVGVAVAGSAMHFLLALVLIFASLVFVGQVGGTLDARDQARTWFIGTVVEGSGADRAGLRPGDAITSVDGEAIDTFADLREAVTPVQGETVPITFERDGRERAGEVSLAPYTYEGRRATGLGVVVDYPEPEELGIVEGIAKTPVEFANVTVQSVQALGRFFSPSGIADFSDQVGSASEDREAAREAEQGGAAAEAPSENRILSIYGLVRIGSDAGAVNPAALITLFAFVNIFIGVFNLVPLLPFDGGHVLIAVYERIQERRLRRRRYFTDVARLLPLTYVVVIGLGMLFISSLYLDIANPLQTQ
jgi:membrane-associated protease RseP (regulator of RpoE activity)